MSGYDETSLYYVYGWRGSKGPFYANNATIADDAIQKAREALKRFSRTHVRDLRGNVTVWESQ